MQYNFSKLKEEILGVDNWFQKELSSIRTGRANPSVLDGIHVDVYGSSMALNQVAGITNEDPRTIRITPWDSTIIKSIEKSITVANLGLSVSVDEKGIRVSFPELTGERRTEIVKLAKSKLEEARVRVRRHRDETNIDIEKKEKAGEMTEDEKFRFKAEMQKIVDECNKKLDEMMSKKEKEILN